MSESAPDTPSHASPLFPVTQWSAIIDVQEGSQNEALLGLERLARDYWQPLYFFARRRGANHEHAADCVQGFLLHLLTGEALKQVEKRETRFRTFLLKVFQNWLINQHLHAVRQKRGGGAVHVPLEDFDTVRSDPALVSNEDPGRSFDRRWARSVFDHALARLDAEIAQKNNPQLHAELRQRITGPGSGSPDWQEVGSRFDMTANAVKQAAHVLRQRLAVLLRQEVRSIVSSEADLEEELRYLVQLLSSPERE